MRTNSRPAFLHPTTLMIVDDDPNFLANLDLALQPGRPSRLFETPEAALDAAMSSSLNEQNKGLLFRSTAGFRDIAYDDDRFSHLAVAVVDYDMPGMDGLTLCERLGSLGIHTILLTGKADESLAVQAFNERSIDRYVRKSSTDFVEQLKGFIDQLEQLHFMELTERLVREAHLNLPEFLTNSAFLSWMDQCLASSNAVEYYLTLHPLGLMTVDSTGKQRFFLIQQHMDIEQHIEIAESEGASAALIAALANAEQLFWFPGPDGYWQEHLADWENYGYPAKVIVDNGIYAAEIENSSSLPEGRELKSYAAYRQALVESERSGQLH